MVGYESKKISITNKSQILNIQLEQKDFELKEVIFKSDRVFTKNDTIVYSVEAFRTGDDKSIGDLLKKLPGVEVQQSGAIKYKGEAITNFYIEGLDLLQQKYGLATNNVPVDAVENVEVIENHQEINALTGLTHADKAAINIKLKDGKLNRPIGTLEVGSGIQQNNDYLWLVNAFVLQAKKNGQSIVMYKSNNMGHDISLEMTEHVLGLVNFDKTDVRKPIIFNDNKISGMQLEDKHYLFNTTHIATVNHLSKLSKTRQLRINMNYMYDARDERMSQNSTYFLPTGDLNINEITTYHQKNNFGDIIATYSENAENFYTKNKLTVKAKWNKANDEIQTSKNIEEKYNLHSYQAVNDLEFVKKIGKNTWIIKSLVDYINKNQNMQVFETGIDNNTHFMKQSVNYNSIYGDLRTSYSHTRKLGSFSVDFLLSGRLENLNSVLNEPIIQSDRLSNAIAYNKIIMEIMPRYNTEIKKNKIEFKTIVRQNIIWVNNSNYEINKNFSPLDIMTRLNISRKLNKMWDGKQSYSYTKNIGDIMDFAVGGIQTEYNSQFYKTGVLEKRSSNAFSAGFNFKNIKKVLYFNTSITYLRGYRNVLSKQKFIDNNIFTTNIAMDNKTNQWLYNSYIGKYIDAISSNISLTADISLSSFQKEQQGILYPFKNNMANLQGQIQTRFTQNFNITYTANYAPSEINIKLKKDDKADNFKSFNWTLSNSMKIYWKIADKWDVVNKWENLTNKLTKGGVKNIFFNDLSISRKFGEFDCNLSWNNIFNQKTYNITTYNDMNIFSYMYKLRPSSIMLSIAFRY